MHFNRFLLRSLCDTPKKAEIVIRQTTLQEYLKDVLETLKKHPKARIFLTKVNKKEAPNYYDVIKNPMDLGTMSRKVHLYRTLDEFKADLDLIWDNCISYNTAEYFIGCSDEMRAVANSILMSNNRVYPQIPEPFTIEGLPHTNAKPWMKRSVAKYFAMAGFGKCEERCLNILSDILGYRIIREIVKYAEYLEQSNKLLGTYMDYGSTIYQ